MKVIPTFLKVDVRHFHDAINTGSLTPLDNLENIGVLKYKGLIVKAICNEVNNFSVVEPHGVLWPLIFRRSLGTVTDSFKSIILNILMALKYDVDSGIKVTDDILLVLIAQFFRGAITLESNALIPLVNISEEMKTHFNVGYRDALVHKVESLISIEEAKVTLTPEEYGAQVSDFNAKNIKEPLSSFNSTLPAESTIKFGEWVNISPVPAKFDVALPCELFEKSDEEEEDSFIEVEIAHDTFKELEVFSSEINEADGFTTLTHKDTVMATDLENLDYDKGPSNPAINAIVSKLEDSAEASRDRDIKMQGTDRAEIARQNAAWHSKKAMGGLPEDAVLPPELEMKPKSTPEQDKVFNEALSVVKEAPAADTELSPLDIIEGLEPNIDPASLWEKNVDLEEDDLNVKPASFIWEERKEHPHGDLNYRRINNQYRLDGISLDYETDEIKYLKRSLGLSYDVIPQKVVDESGVGRLQLELNSNKVNDVDFEIFYDVSGELLSLKEVLPIIDTVRKDIEDFLSQGNAVSGTVNRKTATSLFGLDKANIKNETKESTVTNSINLKELKITRDNLIVLTQDIYNVKRTQLVVDRLIVINSNSDPRRFSSIQQELVNTYGVNDAKLRSDIDDLVKLAILKSGSTIFKLAKCATIEFAVARTPETLSHVILDGKPIYEASGLPLLVDLTTKELYKYSYKEYILNGIITDSFISAVCENNLLPELNYSWSKKDQGSDLEETQISKVAATGYVPSTNGFSEIACNITESLY